MASRFWTPPRGCSMTEEVSPRELRKLLPPRRRRLSITLPTISVDTLDAYVQKRCAAGYAETRSTAIQRLIESNLIEEVDWHE